MSRPEVDGKAPGLFSLGVLLILFSFFSSRIEMEFTTYASVAGYVGIVAIVISAVVNLRAVAYFLRAYWIVLAFVAAALVALFLPDPWVEAIRLSDKLPLWLARIVILLILQGIATLVFLKTRQEGSFRAARAAVAANVTFLLQLGIGLLVAVNVIGTSWTWLTEKSIDTTETRVYTLGGRTRGILDELPDTVYATYLQFGSTYQRTPRGEPLGEQGKDFLRQYADYTPKIVMEVLDPVRDKADAEEYLRKLGLEEFEFGAEDTVVFTYRPPGEDEPNRKDVAVTPWSFVETSQLGTRKFKGEQLYTSAIVDVIHEKKKVYVLKGHGERPLYGGQEPSLNEASELIRKLALEVETLSLAEQGKMPDDADLLIIPGPRTPLLPEERDRIMSYLDRGGSMILALDPQTSLLGRGKVMEFGLEDYLKDLGIEPKPDHACVDFDIAVGSVGEGQLMKTLTITTADYSFHKIVKDLSARGFPCRFPEACPILLESEGEDDKIEGEVLLHVRREGPVRGLRTYAAKLGPGRDPSVEEAGDIRERLPLGVAVEKKLGEGEDAKATRIVVFGDSDFMTTTGISTRSRFYAPGNASLLTNAVSWAVQRESLISIEPKTLETETVTLGDREGKLAYWVGVWAIPALVLFFAIGVAWRRRR
ncbi:MAG: GldG family protein [Planctomycetota bacterium]|jgi:hypothetical protein